MCVGGGYSWCSDGKWSSGNNCKEGATDRGGGGGGLAMEGIQ